MTILCIGAAVFFVSPGVFDINHPSFQGLLLSLGVGTLNSVGLVSAFRGMCCCLLFSIRNVLESHVSSALRRKCQAVAKAQSIMQEFQGQLQILKRTASRCAVCSQRHQEYIYLSLTGL